MQDSQMRQKAYHDRRARARSFEAGEQVYARNFAAGSAWLEGVVSCILGPLSYQVDLDDGRTVRRHVDHLRARSAASTGHTDRPREEAEDMLPSPRVQAQPTSPTDEPGAHEPPTELRRSDQARRPPNFFRPFDFNH